MKTDVNKKDKQMRMPVMSIFNNVISTPQKYQQVNNYKYQLVNTYIHTTARSKN